jgi:predicted O-methyltransferase YrrM
MQDDTSFPGLAAPRVRATLDELHRRAKGDVFVFLRAFPAIASAFVRRRPVFDALEPYLKNAFIPVTPDQGRMLYLMARAIGARSIVEFGTSFGISAIYLSAAAKAAGGRFVGTERDPNKLRAAREHLGRAGLAEVAEVRDGDAMETLASSPGSIDFLFLDGWKDVYLPLVQKLAPRIRPGGLVLADNIHTFKKTLAPYVAWMQDRGNGFESSTIALGHGLELSRKLD